MGALLVTLALGLLAGSLLAAGAQRPWEQLDHLEAEGRLGAAETICGELSSLGRPGQTPDPAVVYELQLGLRLLGLFAHPLDGRYDERTREAVRTVQRASGLRPDGVAGPRTWQALALAYMRQARDLAAAQQAAARAAPYPDRVPRHPDARPGGYWIVIDTQHRHLTLLNDGETVARWPVAVGKPETLTPVGEWRIVYKGRDWGDGFGTRWLGLDVPWGIYGIHGTNKPWSIGTYASAGCIRMFNEDVERLWDAVPPQTPVTIVGLLPEAYWDHPIRAGASGRNVPLLQWALRRAGFDPGRADGRMSPATMQAVQEAQRVFGLAPVEAATVDLFWALGLKKTGVVASSRE